MTVHRGYPCVHYLSAGGASGVRIVQTWVSYAPLSRDCRCDTRIRRRCRLPRARGSGRCACATSLQIPDAAPAAALRPNLQGLCDCRNSRLCRRRPCLQDQACYLPWASIGVLVHKAMGRIARQQRRRQAPAFRRPGGRRIRRPVPDPQGKGRQGRRQSACGFVA